MKLTKVKDKIDYSIYDSIHSKCFYKINDSTSDDIFKKIKDEIWTPNNELIERMKIRTLNNLRNEIN